MSNLVKALEIAQASQDAMTDFEVMMAAAHLYKTSLNNPTEEEMQELIFKYSALLTASVSTRITSILMTKNDFNSMVSEIDEMDEITKQVLGE